MHDYKIISNDTYDNILEYDNLEKEKDDFEL
jgi:hypothetical protein